MELKTVIIPATKEMSGLTSFNINSGKSLKIETSPNGEEILKVVVPVGKKWTVWFNIDIDEQDA